MRLVALVALVVAPTLLPAAPAPKAGPPRLVAVSSHKDGLWGIYVVHPDTGESKRLTDPKKVCYGPSWAPDGSRIAFSSESEIWTMKPDGSDARQLTRTQGSCSERRWSPDGSRIAFVLGKDGKDRICVVDVANGKLSEVTDGSFPCEQLAWAPDGKRLLYARRVGKWALHTINPDGTDDRKVTDPLGGRNAALAPDGSRIVYTTFLSDPPPGWHLFTIGVDGKGKKRLTTDPNSDGYGSPQWSPDGNLIAFSTTVEGTSQVWVMSAAGGEAKVVTSGPRAHNYPRWSPDGKSLCYVRTEKGQRGELVISDPDGTNAKVLLTQVGEAFEWKPK